MILLSDALQHLAEKHRSALNWFLENKGKTVPWPEPLSDGTLLVTKAKGIYKPQWSEYALSVKQTLDSQYPDRDPAFREDRTWKYDYFQENLDPEARDSAFTNNGLLRCLEDRVPVGVLIQAQAKPYALYRVLGLALIDGWNAGFFELEGFNDDGTTRFSGKYSVEKYKRDALSETPALDLQEIAKASNFPKAFLGATVRIKDIVGKIVEVADDGSEFQILDLTTRKPRKFKTAFLRKN